MTKMDLTLINFHCWHKSIQKIHNSGMKHIESCTEMLSIKICLYTLNFSCVQNEIWCSNITHWKPLWIFVFEPILRWLKLSASRTEFEITIPPNSCMDIRVKTINQHRLSKGFSSKVTRINRDLKVKGHNDQNVLTATTKMRTLRDWRQDSTILILNIAFDIHGKHYRNYQAEEKYFYLEKIHKNVSEIFSNPIWPWQ